MLVCEASGSDIFLGFRVTIRDDNEEYIRVLVYSYTPVTVCSFLNLDCESMRHVPCHPIPLCDCR